MKAVNVKLNRNLRRRLLQGSPWIYKEAVTVNNSSEVALCKVEDSKSEFVGWGMHCPNSPLAVRMLSLEKKPPQANDFKDLIQRAWCLRQNLSFNNTNCFRLINGEGDGLPGLICDVYGDVGVIQFDGEGPNKFWQGQWVAQSLLEITDLKTIYFKPRHDSSSKAQSWGEDLRDFKVKVQENGVQFFVDIQNGQKTGFFLDQRDNRNHLKGFSKNQSVLNLFSYSGGFSVYAGVGGANRVTSVDIAQGALDLAAENWRLNDLNAEGHQAYCADVMEFLSSHKESYDIVICDPPSFAKSEKHKKAAINKYVECFTQSAKLVRPGGHLMLSSCSSHIDFDCFKEIYTMCLSKARRRGQVLRLSGQGADHPFPHSCPELRYLKFVDMILTL